MTTVLNGLLGGVTAAIVATLVLRLLDAEPLVMAIRGGDPVTGSDAGRARNDVVQLVYGTVAGGALVALELSVLDVLSVPPAGSVALGLALAWSAVLALILLLVNRVAGAPNTSQWFRTLLIFHLSYGLALGLWIRTTWIT